jgi:outer membrane protein assembly factor BamA
MAALAGWWDPNLAAGVDPRGQLDVEGFVSIDPATGLEIELAHRGRPLTIAGYDIETAVFSLDEGTPAIRLGDPGWGRASVRLTAPDTVAVDALLDGAPVDRLLAFFTPRAAEVIRGPATLTGEIDGVLSYPLTAETLEGRADLELSWADGHVALQVEGAGTAWEVAELEASAAGATLTAAGRLDSIDGIDADVALSVDRPRILVDAIDRWLPALGELGIDGGPMVAEIHISGTLDDPMATAEITWSEPLVGGRRLESCSIKASGGLENVTWELDAAATLGSSMVASGWVRPADRTAGGVWRVQASDLGEVASAFAPARDLDVFGRLAAAGSFAVSAEEYRIDGTVSGDDLGAGGVSVPTATASFSVETGTLLVEDLHVVALGGVIEGGWTVPLTGASAPIDADLEWRDLDLADLPIAAPDAVVGLIAGRLELGGSTTRPEGSLRVSWQADGQDQLVESVILHASLSEGVLQIVTEEARTATGPIVVNAVLPLGDLPRPEWLWPDAPGGELRATVEGLGLHSGPVMEAFGRADWPGEASADLRIEVSWDPLHPDRTRVLAEANGLRLRHPTGELVAEGPLIITLDGKRLQVAPVVLSGPNGRIEARAEYDPAVDQVLVNVHAVLSPGLARALPLPFPLNLQGDLTVTADLQAPASTSASLEEIRGLITIDHRGGTIVMRDPPLEVKDLNVVVELDDDGITIVDGSAEVNRGRVELGGGWSRASGQGVVIELEDVTMLTAGVLTKWDGDISIEPSAEGLAHVVGDLRLAAGLWDENFALTSAVFGPVAVAPASDDPLHDISLDIAVQGRSGIRVDNNLGRFDVAWDWLLIGGTAAIPVVEGEMRIAPGGTLSLAGQEVKVRRGSLRFTGDPTLDPIVEIVPESDTTWVGGGSGEAFDATLMATRGLAQGLTSVLGFENETLQPAEIAVQTARDPSVNFMIGQRLTRNLALFLTTNLTDVQDRTTMLQLWNFRGFRGLVAQVYQETVDDNLGMNLFQRFQWGGTTIAGDRPEIHRLRLEGEWPMSKRALRRSTRLRRGQPFDPFLLFVAAVRMERTLAEHGYQEARVTAAQRGSERSPTLVFHCDPGPLQMVIFEDDVPPAHVRREVTALYRPPPLEEAALANMRAVVLQHSAMDGFPKAEVTVARHGEEIVVGVGRGEKLLFGGLALEGVPEVSAPAIRRLLGSSSVLVMAAAEPERITATVTRVMANQGYLEVRVSDVEVVLAGPETAEVRITVEAGPREVIDEVQVVGQDPLDLAAEGELALRTGAPLDRSAIDVVARRLRGAYHDAGFRDAEVHAAIDRTSDGRWVVELEIDPGHRRTVREVRFTGARGLSERVLRKGLTVTQGEVLTNSDLDQSASRIANFAPVERIEVRTIEEGDSETDIEINVVSNRRWTAEVGGGWSTERGMQARFGLRDDNLFARGVGLNLRGNMDATERRIFLVGSLPPTPGSRLTLIATMGYSVGDAPEEPDLLEQAEELLSFEAQYAVSRTVTAKTYYRWTNTHTYEKDPDPDDFFTIDSRTKVGLLGMQTVIDRFDSLFDPRSGFGLTSDLGWSSSAVGSDLEYMSWLTNFTLALEPFSDYTWIQTLRVGVAEPLKGTNLDPEARFFAGGQSSIRGFDLNSVGPVKLGIEGALVPAGGGGLFILNEELRIPVWGSLRAAVFADIGQVWPSWSEADLDFSIGVGVGVRWSTPIGPVWADVAWPVANVGISSKKPKFYLGFGRPF